jgi:hypothetical protein
MLPFNSAMRLLGFRPPAPIATRTDLERFLDRQAAFMVQKCIFEYSRARSGVLSTKLFKEAAFKAAVDTALWRNYPLCLQNSAVMVEHALRPAAGDRATDLREGLVAAVGAVCGRYSIPAGMQQDFWAQAVDSIGRRLRQAGLAAPRAVKDIPCDTADAFFAGLPIHPDLTGFDYELIANNLRVNLCRAYEDFIAVADIPALIAALTAAAAAPAAKEAG